MLPEIEPHVQKSDKKLDEKKTSHQIEQLKILNDSITNIKVKCLKNLLESPNQKTKINKKRKKFLS